MPVSLADKTPDWKAYKAGSPEAVTFFSRLAHGRVAGEIGAPQDADYVFHEMLLLLNKGADRLTVLIGHSEALSLLGRALFFRFLCDRGIVTHHDLPRIAPNASSLPECFDNAENACSTSQWLDETFNGDFMPLGAGGGHEFFGKMQHRNLGDVFPHLTAIVQRFKPVGADEYQSRLPIEWSDFDFAHVPVGLLSQVYEAFCWQLDHRRAKETSVYYTPRMIAAILVDEAFDGLVKADEARVLDPACGAGVFMVLAFRRLYQERWRTTGVRPDTAAIREILNKQLTGFDINDDALKLTALALYLTAIELDPKPIPPEKLKFSKLTGHVLFNHRRPSTDAAEGPVIGSLGQHVSREFDEQFDLVLSNPPWTSLTSEYSSLAAEYTLVSRAIIERKGEHFAATGYQNSDAAPDIPIVWKSTEWCKPDGRIAMVLPARILLKQEPVPSRARETLFRLVEVTGILNGSNLADSGVWPRMNQPFMLFFARNKRPTEGHAIRLITPQYDAALNHTGEIRIDAKSTQTVEVALTFDEPWLWKALSIGTSLDVEVIRHLKSVGGRPLAGYWTRDLGLVSGAGYQINSKLGQRDASFLRGLPNLDETSLFAFLVKPQQLQPFSRSAVCWPRRRQVYSAPLALIKESPGSCRESGFALLSFEDVAFTESFYGFSGAGHHQGESLVRYLHLFMHSFLWTYYVLLTSPKFGVERRVLYKRDIDECPIVPFDALAAEQRGQVLTLSRRLEVGDRRVFEEVDTLFAGIYGLDELDIEVIRDTLNVCLPYTDSRRRACQVPTRLETETFRKHLEGVIGPFFRVLGKEPQVVPWPELDLLPLREGPFDFFWIAERDCGASSPPAAIQKAILQLANDTGTTRIVQDLGGSMLIGILRQYRYWTPSRARLLGAEIVRQHMHVFENTSVR
jgi:hypothetical protein